ncbi:MAG: S41 family peptidase [Eubacteriales bacterium]|nr:S41 family peptidase [Eubacteriales bacterium]MDD4323296.1 S41 family peptidase [Eubacteriales bacterium]MDD4540971.1 S41 family peptidase [Eubacteriales bacterium]
MQEQPQDPYSQNQFDPYSQAPQNPQIQTNRFGNYPPRFPQDIEEEEKRACKRGMRWRIFLAVLLTATITFLLTAGIAFALYGDAIRELGGNRLGFLDDEVADDAFTMRFPSEDGVAEALSKLDEAYDLIYENYIDELSHAELIEIMTQGLVDNVESPYTFYLSPEDNQASQDAMSGEYSGIGAIVMMDDAGYFVVNDVVMDSPAEEAGVAIDDRIIAVDGESTLDINDVSQLANMIRGEDGTEVSITFFRPSENREIVQNITRRRITNASLTYEMLEDGIAYIRLTEFSAHAAENFETAVLDLLDQGAQHIVIDLRSNGGGYAYQCIDMLDVLLPPQTVATVEGRSEGEDYTEEWKTDEPALVPEDMTYVVLLNRYSASASELFAGVLRDLDKAVLVGEKSYGKGVGTLTWSLSDNSAIQVTTFEYFLPGGESIDGIGLVPDEEIALDEAVANKPVNQLSREEDTQLAKAIEILEARVK